jgi:hypothetical protein
LGVDSLGNFSGSFLLKGIQLIGELLQGDRGAHWAVVKKTRL